MLPELTELRMRSTERGMPVRSHSLDDIFKAARDSFKGSFAKTRSKKRNSRESHRVSFSMDIVDKEVQKEMTA